MEEKEEEEAIKAKRPAADGYQSSVASSCILNICTALGEASEAYGSDSITVLILGCGVTAGQADRNQNVTDFGEKSWQWKESEKAEKNELARMYSMNNTVELVL